MKKFYKLFILLLSCSSFMLSSQSLSDHIVFTDASLTSEYLSTPDAYTDSWSQFDIDVRLQKEQGSKEELLALNAASAKPWTEDEKAKVMAVITKIEGILAKENYSLKVPEALYFLRSTGEEQGYPTSYARLEYIVFCDKFSDLSEDKLEEMILRKLFHVVSAHDYEFKTSMYALIQFKMLNGTIAYPQSLQRLKVTNPNAPLTESYIRLNIKNESKLVAMIVYSNESYKNAPITDYLRVGFLEMADNGNGPIVYMKNGSPTIYSMSEAATSFYKAVGINPSLAVHPDEIMAENFALAFNLNKQIEDVKIVQKVKEVLRGE